jgi:hypothetical protein
MAILKIETVRKFKVDGKEFDSEVDARKYAVEHEALGKLRALLNAAINSELVRKGNVDNVLRNILGEASAVSEVLSSYRKKQPKEVAAKAA